MIGRSCTRDEQTQLTLEVFAFGMAVLGLTAFHHAWGAMIYEAPFRLHMVLIGLPTIFLLAALAHVAVRWRDGFAGTAARVAGTILVLLFPLAMIGVYEGFYNHVIKIVFYSSDALRGYTASLFTPGLYEPPTNWVFEVTGVLQFPIAVAGLRSVARLFRLGILRRSPTAAPPAMPGT